MRTSQRMKTRHIETTPLEEIREIRLVTRGGRAAEPSPQRDLYDRMDGQIESLVALLAAERLLSSAASEVDVWQG